MINSITINHEQHTLQEAEQASTQNPEETLIKVTVQT